MNFRLKLTLTFSLLTTAVLVIMSVLIYYFAEQYTRNQFFDRLMERGMISAQMYLERDELSERSIQKVQRKFFQSLTEEVLNIYDEERHPKFALDSTHYDPPAHIFEDIESQKFVEFWQGKKQGVGFWYEDNQGDFFIIVSARDASGTEKLQNLRSVLELVVLGGCLSMLVLGYFFASQVLQPIKQIVDEVNQIRATKLHKRVKERSSRDEIGELINTFNQMLERLEISFSMQKSFIANASHELRNPLTAISGEIEVTLLRDRTVEEYKQSLETLQKETDRLQQLTKDLILLAQTGFDEQEIRSETVRLDEVILEVKSTLDKQRPNNLIQVQLGDLPEQPDALDITGNASLVKIALTNVLDNAVKFSMGTPVLLQLQFMPKHIAVVVKDQGMGIPENEINLVMQPFYRAYNARTKEGTGIGLPLSEKIMRLHGGEIRITSQADQGTEVTLIFPSKA